MEGRVLWRLGICDVVRCVVRPTVSRDSVRYVDGIACRCCITVEQMCVARDVCGSTPRGARGRWGGTGMRGGSAEARRPDPRAGVRVGWAARGRQSNACQLATGPRGSRGRDGIKWGRRSRGARVERPAGGRANTKTCFVRRVPFVCALCVGSLRYTSRVARPRGGAPSRRVPSVRPLARYRIVVNTYTRALYI